MIKLDDRRIAATKCYIGLGCLSLNSSWYDLLYRPVNLFPQSRDEISTNFTLATRSVPVNVRIIR